MLQIYNTLSKEKEIFKPRKPGKVDLYVCGPTVYDQCHVGHARVFLVFDTIVRYLQYLGFEVKYVRNITDIDDKIIKRAEENNETIHSLTSRVIEAMTEDFDRLNLLPPTVQPKATEYIEPMLELIERLIAKGYAYVGANHDVYYDVQKFESYGCLSHRDLNELQAGSRVEVNEAKRNPLDFVLWKMAKAGEPSWHSPWGLGRPGWHIECSAMSLRNLGETFDIHGGGPDLKFPHHENERAQSEAANGKHFVNYWMHVGFVQKDKEKMSKSLGNFLTIREFLKSSNPETLRYFSISSHYRSPVEFTDEHLESAYQALERFYITLRGLPMGEDVKIPLETEFEQRFQKAMNDDFNTPEALAVLFDLVRHINRLREQDLRAAVQWGMLLRALGNVLGILYHDPEQFLQNLMGKSIAPKEIEDLIEQRNMARAAKNWQEADRIRDKLLSQGVTLEDTPMGTLWQSASNHEGT